MGLLSRLFGKPKPQIELSGPGTFAIDIVGESRYQRPLDAISGGRTPNGVRVTLKATLIHEDDNPADAMAIRVDINRNTVGYLDRQNAREYRANLKHAGYAGCDASCNAIIVGGWDRGPDDQGHFGVKLDLPTGESAPQVPAKNRHVSVQQEVELALESKDFSGIHRALARKSRSLSDRHFLLLSVVRHAYNRRADAAFRDLLKQIGKIHIDEFPKFAKALKKEFDGSLPRVPTFQNLATALTEDGEFVEAIQICERAISFGLVDGTKGGFEGRIRSIQRKMNKQNG